MGGGHRMVVHEVVEPRDLAGAQGEDRRPPGLDHLAGRIDGLTLVSLDHRPVAPGQILLELERLELRNLAECLGEPRHFATAAVEAGVSQLGWRGKAVRRQRSILGLEERFH
jgi:hypothetical protein